MFVYQVELKRYSDLARGESLFKQDERERVHVEKVIEGCGSDDHMARYRMKGDRSQSDFQQS